MEANKETNSASKTKDLGVNESELREFASIIENNISKTKYKVKSKNKVKEPAKFVVEENWPLFHNFLPTKNYNVSLNFANNQTTSPKQCWERVLNFWVVNSCNHDVSFLDEEENKSLTELVGVIKENWPELQIGYIEDIRHLIGFLVNRGPVIVSDFVIYGVNTSEQTFQTTKGIKKFSVIETNLIENHAISAIIY